MTRVIRGPQLHRAPIDVPAPPAWDSVALAAFEQGFQQGVVEGRRDISALEHRLADAVGRCLAAIDGATVQMADRVLEVSELFVTTALRHVPEARTAGLLVRLGEVLRAFEPEPLEISVSPHDVAEVVEVVASRGAFAARVDVVGDPSLHQGEFRIHSEWADADGTFGRYLEAARDALERAVGGGAR